MKTGDFHAFPPEVDNHLRVDGVAETIVGGDGVARTRVRIDGEYRGREGYFEYIFETDGVTINHRLFVVRRPQEKL